MVTGIIYNIGPIGSPWGVGRLPADLLAGVNVANSHISMACQLLELIEGIDPHEYRRILDERHGRSQVAWLVNEICCQNGAEVVTALHDFFTKTDALTNPIRVGPVSEANPLAAAFAAAQQVADDVQRGEAPTITSAELWRLSALLEEEAYLLACQRATPGSSDAPAPAPATPEKGELPKDLNPVKYLYGWTEILDALGLAVHQANKTHISSMNETFDGPIKRGTKGQRPLVVKDKLWEWWHQLEQRYDENRQNESNRQATVEARHPYGRTGEVVPNLGGHVKKRRRKSR
jgi:hypothetical protein